MSSGCTAGRTKILTYGAVAVLCAIVFCSIYGVRVLNPTYTDWMLLGEKIPLINYDVQNDMTFYSWDLPQHYLGWKAYRAGGWHFLFGMIDNLAWPEQVSVMFTDSIPVFAVFFKLLSPVLPASFQYFGWWGLMSFVLQGVLAARIIGKYTDKPVITVFASVLFVFVPAMLWRMFVHTALAGQWILLLAVEPIFDYDKYAQNPRKLYILTVILGVLTVFVHMYFTLMCGIILVGFCLLDILKRKTVKRSAALIGIYIVFAAVSTVLLGGFSSPLSADAFGLGLSSFNLNSFTNPKGWSLILQTKPVYDYFQYEGFAYLGVGCILLCFAALILFFGSGRVKEIWAGHWKTAAALLTVMIISIAFAASPVITFGDRVLLEIHVPQLVWKAWSIFRASGRIVWCAVYVLMLCSCIMVCRLANRRTAGILFAAVLAVQAADLSPALLQIHRNIARDFVYESPLADTEFWDYVGESEDIRHIVYESSLSGFYMYGFTDWAAGHGKTVNNFYFARQQRSEVYMRNKETALNTLPEDTLIIFSGEKRENYRDYDMFCYEADGVVVGRSIPIGDFEPIQTK